ncbi:MAG TPA: PKD domain-containing protein, partial [Thermoplasmatales archaeon]|nr:PKD domain-containing protein [Thermoplasmatales archaeon]
MRKINALKKISLTCFIIFFLTLKSFNFESCISKSSVEIINKIQHKLINNYFVDNISAIEDFGDYTIALSKEKLGIELIDRRTPFSRHFRNEDGSITAVLSLIPTSYKDEYGKWHDISINEIESLDFSSYEDSIYYGFAYDKQGDGKSPYNYIFNSVYDGNLYYIGIGWDKDGQDETYRGFAQWDTSSIPDNSNITQVELRIYVTSQLTDPFGVDNWDNYQCHLEIFEMSNKPSDYYSGTGSAPDGNSNVLFDDANDGICYLSYDLINAGDGWTQYYDLGINAEIALENQLQDDWFAVGFHDWAEGSSDEGVCIYGGGIYGDLKITYTEKYPDIIVDNIWTSPSPLYDGDDVTVHVRIKNIGDGSANGLCRIETTTDGYTQSIYPFIDLNPNDTLTYDFLFSGMYVNFPVFNVTACADCWDDIVESNESNNCRSESFIVYESLIVDANGPYNGIVNTPIQFNCLVAGGLPPYNYTWDFGDGNVSYEQNVTHIYRNALNYTVILTVKDANMRSNTSITYALITEPAIVSIEDYFCNPNESIVSSIRLYNISDLIIANVSLSFNSSVARAISADESDFDLINFTIDNVTGRITINATHTNTSLNGNVTLLNITFKAIGKLGDISPLSFTSVHLENSQRIEIISISDNGTFYITDLSPPKIIDNTPSYATTGDIFTFNATVADNVAVANVYVEYWYDFENHTNISMNYTGNYWKYTILVNDMSKILHYIFSTVDSSGNWNNTSIKNVTIVDTTPPEIKNVSANPLHQEYGKYVNITCDVTDNVAVNVVKVNITYPDNSQHNFTMNAGYYFNQSYSMIGTYHYFIWANDTSSNSNVSSTYTFTIVDTTPPEIKNVSANPQIQEYGKYVNITCDVTDNVGVNVVKVNITYPDNSQHNFTMNAGYYFNQSYSMIGTYHYFIWANDTSSNSNVSTIHEFIIANDTSP